MSVWETGNARDRLARIVASVSRGGGWIEEHVHHTPSELAADLRAVLDDLTEAERLLDLVGAHDGNLVDSLNGWADPKPRESLK